MKRFGAMLALLSSLYAPRAASADAALTTTLVANGLARPLFVTHAPGDFSRIFVIEQRVGTGTTARIRIVTLPDHTLLATPFLTVSGVSTGDEQGLLGLAFHPNYASNGYFYINYTDSGGTTRIVRYTVSADPNVADAASATAVLSISQPFANHNGGWMGFGPDGYLYISTGDGGSANDPGNRAQNKDLLLGKMLRIDVNGDDFPGDNTKNYSNPPDNPFVGAAGADEVWAYGLRNPWRPSFDRATGDLFIADVGQGTWEEIDFQPASSQGGENYGWRCMEGNHCTGQSGCTCDINCGNALLVCPIYEYNHNADGFSCSVTGGYVYRGCAIPDLVGTYFFADYCSNRIKSFRYDGTISGLVDRTTELDPPGGATITSITSFGEDAFGELYICDRGGEVFKIIPVDPQGPDCNANGRNDACDILAGSSTDCNGDGVPDDCQTGLTPEITDQPDGGLVCAGSGFALTVAAAGAAPLAYQWRKDGVDIGGATLPTLTIPAAATSDRGGYTVVVSNGCGSVVSDEALLSVFDPCDDNCDGTVNGLDIENFVALLAGAGQACSPCAADANADGSVNGADIDGFIACLGG